MCNLFLVVALSVEAGLSLHHYHWWVTVMCAVLALFYVWLTYMTVSRALTDSSRLSLVSGTPVDFYGSEGNVPRQMMLTQVTFDQRLNQGTTATAEFSDYSPYLQERKI